MSNCTGNCGGGFPLSKRELIAAIALNGILSSQSHKTGFIEQDDSYVPLAIEYADQLIELTKEDDETE